MGEGEGIMVKLKLTMKAYAQFDEIQNVGYI